MKSTHAVRDQAFLAPFGERRPPRLVEWVIRFLHRENPTVLQRSLAPIARKIISNFCDLPIDISTGHLKLRCKITDNYSEKKFVFTPWRYDRIELAALVDALPEDGVFVDIGANVGLYTLIAARAMKEQGKILALEPGSFTRRRLETNLEANRQTTGWPTISVLNVGIADQNGERVLQINDQNLGASSIASVDETAQEETIQCRLLTTVLFEEGITHIDVLKIDIEGAEDIALVPFLEQAEDSLLPKLVIIENSEHRWSQDLFGLFFEKGYNRIARTRLNSVLRKA